MKRLQILLLIPVFLCILWGAYFILMPWIDRLICVVRVSHQVGVNSSYENIKEFIGSSLSTGMTREDVRNVLKNIGPIDVLDGDIRISNRATDQIWLKMCLHPFNYLVIYAHFNMHGILQSFEIEDDDP